MKTLADAVVLLQEGNWEAAHGIAQADVTTLGAWAHGIVHMLEGDRRNAGYWYGRAGRELPSQERINDEITALKTEMMAKSRCRS